MKKIIIVLIFVAILLIIIIAVNIFPVFIRMDDSIDLGNKYRYIQDYPQTIIYQTSEKHKGSGKNIVPPIVLKYAYNEEYIIAETKDLETKDTLYWVVNKKTGKYEKCDSLNFEQLKKEYNVPDTLMLK